MSEKKVFDDDKFEKAKGVLQSTGLLALEKALLRYPIPYLKKLCETHNIRLPEKAKRKDYIEALEAWVRT